jgi:hypothetical protein
MRAVAIAVLALALLPATAAAKTGISINSTPDGLAAGEPWNVEFEYIRNDKTTDPPAGSRPAVEITSDDGSRTLSFRGHRLRDGQWSARVVFPTAGRWTFKIRGFGAQVGEQFWDPVTILPAARSSHPREVQAGVGGGGFPYGWVGAGAVAALAAAGGLALRRART